MPLKHSAILIKINAQSEKGVIMNKLFTVCIMCVCVRACVRVCVRGCVCVCVSLFNALFLFLTQ